MTTALDQPITRELDEGTVTTVVTAVADAKHVAPDDLDTCLYDVVHPGALESLFSTTHAGKPRRGGYVQFTFVDHVVRVAASGLVTVWPPQAVPDGGRAAHASSSGPDRALAADGSND